MARSSPYDGSSPRLTWSELGDFCRIVSLCVCWYSVSSANGVMGKWILSEFPHPMTLTLVQLAAITVFARPALRALGIRPMTGLSRRHYWRMVVPLAAAKFLSSVFAHVSIWKVPVSYAHTVKASMPLFTVAISKCVRGEKHSARTYLSLLPIIMGVAVATVTEVSFDAAGLVSALASTAILAGQATFTKTVNEETGVHALRLLQVLSQLSLLMFFPVWLYFDFGDVIAHPAVAGITGGAQSEVGVEEDSRTVSLAFLLAVDAVCHFLQNIVAFTIMNRLSRLSYAVASATKRIVIITTSLLLLQNHVTGLNILGMSMAIGGVMCYNKVKLDEKRSKESLPTTMSGSNGVNKTLAPLWNNNHYSSPKVKLLAPTDFRTVNGKYRPYQA